MEENRSVFDYISKVFSVFGVVILIHVVIGLLVGADASEMSTLFTLGSEGLAMATIVQLFAMSVVVIIWQTILRNMPPALMILS